MVTEQKDIAAKIGARLREARRRARLNQVEVADRVGVAPNTLCGWEAGERMPRAIEVLNLAEIYGCTADFLLGRTVHTTGLPVAELLVDQDVVNQVLRAESPADIEELVDWQPQMISFWQIVTRGSRVRTRRQVQALTVELANHVQQVAPDLWRMYEQGAAELTKRRNQWKRRRPKTDSTDF